MSLHQRANKYFEQWSIKRKSVFESRVHADSFVFTVFLCGICVGVPQLSDHELAHLRLLARGSASIDWYDNGPLIAGDRDPMQQFSTDRITPGSDKKMLPYSDFRQCTVAASLWNNA
jgi:hypothetical protein